jgi:hypothetical protein
MERERATLTAESGLTKRDLFTKPGRAAIIIEEGR